MCLFLDIYHRVNITACTVRSILFFIWCTRYTGQTSKFWWFFLAPTRLFPVIVRSRVTRGIFHLPHFCELRPQWCWTSRSYCTPDFPLSVTFATPIPFIGSSDLSVADWSPISVTFEMRVGPSPLTRSGTRFGGTSTYCRFLL